MSAGVTEAFGLGKVVLDIVAPQRPVSLEEAFAKAARNAKPEAVANRMCGIVAGVASGYNEEQG